MALYVVGDAGEKQLEAARWAIGLIISAMNERNKNTQAQIEQAFKTYVDSGGKMTREQYEKLYPLAARRMSFDDLSTLAQRATELSKQLTNLKLQREQAEISQTEAQTETIKTIATNNRLQAAKIIAESQNEARDKYSKQLLGEASALLELVKSERASSDSRIQAAASIAANLAAQRAQFIMQALASGRMTEAEAGRVASTELKSLSDLRGFLESDAFSDMSEKAKLTFGYQALIGFMASDPSVSTIPENLIDEAAKKTGIDKKSWARYTAALMLKNQGGDQRRLSQVLPVAAGLLKKYGDDPKFAYDVANALVKTPQDADKMLLEVMQTIPRIVAREDPRAQQAFLNQAFNLINSANAIQQKQWVIEPVYDDKGNFIGGQPKEVTLQQETPTLGSVNLPAQTVSVGGSSGRSFSLFGQQQAQANKPPLFVPPPQEQPPSQPEKKTPESAIPESTFAQDFASFLGSLEKAGAGIGANVLTNLEAAKAYFGLTPKEEAVRRAQEIEEQRRAFEQWVNTMAQLGKIPWPR